MKNKHVLIFLATLLLSSCLSPVKTPDSTTYVLKVSPSVPVAKYTRGANLMVMPPDTLAAYNTTSMAYTAKPFQLAYFGQNRWAETPSQMLHPLIVQTLQSTHLYHAIVTPPYIGRYDYVLTTQILAAEQDFLSHPATFKLRLRLQLYSVKRNQVIATKNVFISEPIYHQTPYAGVVAGNIATAKALKEMARFCTLYR